MPIQLTTPFSKTVAISLKTGDTVLLSGTIYTARDAAHARLVDLIEQKKPLPFPIEDAVLYYVGPTPSRHGKLVGSAGPTTSSRMDKYTPALLAQGLRAMIGKGMRSQAVIESMKAHQAVYFGAIGGAAALVANTITAASPVCYQDLGAEAVMKWTVKDFPLTVVIDTKGANLYEVGPKTYLENAATSETR